MNSSKKGRPRSDKARAAILNAAHELLQDHPLLSITMDQIAQQAGVSKATLYRWWPHKLDVLIDAFVEHSPPRAQPTPGQGPLATLKKGLADLLDLFLGKEAQVIADIVGHGRAYPKAVRLFREGFLEPRRTIARQLMREAQAQGEIHTDLDVEIALDMIFGPLYYRLLVQHLPLDKSMNKKIEYIIENGFR